MLSLNHSGQGFSVFRLLISAIMGMMILLIILSVADYFNQTRLNLGYQKIVDAFGNAANKADGTVIPIEEVELPAQSEISALSLSQGSGVEKECVKITGAETSFVKFPSDSLARIERNVKLKVYIKCETNLGDCETYCTVSLNKKIE